MLELFGLVFVLMIVLVFVQALVNSTSNAVVMALLTVFLDMGIPLDRLEGTSRDWANVIATRARHQCRERIFIKKL